MLERPVRVAQQRRPSMDQVAGLVAQGLLAEVGVAQLADRGLTAPRAGVGGDRQCCRRYLPRPGPRSTKYCRAA